MKWRTCSRRRLRPECRRVAVLLPALPDGELRRTDARRLTTHLTVCAACRREADLFMGLGELVRQASREDTDGSQDADPR